MDKIDSLCNKQDCCCLKLKCFSMSYTLRKLRVTRTQFVELGERKKKNMEETVKKLQCRDMMMLISQKNCPLVIILYNITAHINILNTSQ